MGIRKKIGVKFLMGTTLYIELISSARCELFWALSKKFNTQMDSILTRRKLGTHTQFTKNQMNWFVN